MTGFTISRYVALAQALQAKILNGDYSVGEKLPTEKELAVQHNVAVMTVRQGVGLLVQKGLVERRHGLGTFVLRTSQAKANVALLFGDCLSVESAHYYRALVARFEAGTNLRQWNLRQYDRLNREMFPASFCNQREQTLLSDHRHEPFSGLIEMTPGVSPIIPRELIGVIPQVRSEPGSRHSDIASDELGFGTKAVEHLVQAGCRRLLYFATAWESPGQVMKIPAKVDVVMDVSRRHGLPPVSVHVEPVRTQGYEMERQLFERFAQLVRGWNQPGKTAPDGIIFHDDIALRSVAPAMLQAGIVVPRDMKVFCAGNEDIRFHYGFPIIRYEISPRRIVDHLLSVLDRRINGETGVIPPFRSKGKIAVD